MGLLGSSDVILIDAAAGLGREALASIESSDEMLLVTNPELPAVLDVMKAAKLARQMGSKVIGVVINKSTGKRHELTDKQIGDLIEAPIISKIPEEDYVKESISLRMPVVKYKPNCNSSIEIKRLASYISGESFDFTLPWHRRLFSMLFK
jgi:septum site-determining protein MinD